MGRAWRLLKDGSEKVEDLRYLVRAAGFSLIGLHPPRAAYGYVDSDAGVPHILFLPLEETVLRPFQWPLVAHLIDVLQLPLSDTVLVGKPSLGHGRPLEPELPILYPVVMATWLALVPDLPGCVADGTTPEGAAEEAMAMVPLWLAAARRLGRTLPAPSTLEQAVDGCGALGEALQCRFNFIASYSIAHRELPWRPSPRSDAGLRSAFEASGPPRDSPSLDAQLQTTMPPTAGARVEARRRDQERWRRYLAAIRGLFGPSRR